ncbi:MAG: hypothetical protein QF473_18315 [Planctomycetota bacterium]|nr:hypothetical protein [Planctomycetota bacterium]
MTPGCNRFVLPVVLALLGAPNLRSKDAGATATEKQLQQLVKQLTEREHQQWKTKKATPKSSAS